MEGISKSQVSRLCGEIDERVQRFLARPIEGEWPYVWRRGERFQPCKARLDTPRRLDATYVKARRDHHIVSVAVIVAVGVNTDGRRELLGMTVDHSEAEPFWLEFLLSLARRGLRGVKLVTQVARNAHAVLLCDGAGWHQIGERLHVPDNITLLPLPPYAPELNPMENVWEYLRANKLCNRVWDGYEAIIDACK